MVQVWDQYKKKAKDFKGSIMRLLKELKPFHILISIALILAMLGSILSILAPNKLSSLTDKITEGLVINSDNLKTISSNIEKSINEESLKEKNA